MSEAYASVGFRACLAVAAELRAVAVDSCSDLPMRERRALAILASEVEARAAQRAGVEIDGRSTAAAVAEALVALDAALRPARPSRAYSGRWTSQVSRNVQVWNRHTRNRMEATGEPHYGTLILMAVRSLPEGSALFCWPWPLVLDLSATPVVSLQPSCPLWRRRSVSPNCRAPAGWPI